MLDYLEKQKEPISWELRLRFAEKIFNTLVFLHQKKIFHRDGKKRKDIFWNLYFLFNFFFLVRVTNILLDKELNPKLGGDLNERRRFFFSRNNFFFCLDFGIAVLEGVFSF